MADRMEILRRAEVARLAASQLCEAIQAAGLGAGLIAAAHRLDDAASDLAEDLACDLAGAKAGHPTHRGD